MCRSREKEALARRLLLQVCQLLTLPGTCLIDIATLLNAMKLVLVEEPDRFNTELQSVELSICSYKLSMHIYLFLALRALCAVIYLFSGMLYLALEFCA